MSFIDVPYELFQNALTERGYQEVIVDGIGEILYVKDYDPLELRIYSTLDKKTKTIRDKGKDAIRSVLFHKGLNSTVTGKTKTLRTGSTAEVVIDRLLQKIGELELRAEELQSVYKLIGESSITSLTQLMGKNFMLKSKKDIETSKGKKAVQYDFLGLFLYNGERAYMTIKTMPFAVSKVFGSCALEPEDIIKVSMCNPGEQVAVKSGKSACFINVSRYGNYLFGRDTDEIRFNKVDMGAMQIISDNREAALESADVHKLPIPLPYPLNPMQEEVWSSEAIQRGDNVIVSAQTASGKTVVGILAIAQCVKQYKTAIYMSPMKSLSEEKVSDLRHYLGDMNLKIEIVTGDYTMDERRKMQLETADVIVMTSEMVGSLCTKHSNNPWLKEVGCLVVDEAHLISSEGRGDKVEISLMQFLDVNPNAQVLMLSATLSDLDKLASWISDLSNRPTQVIESDYRPCELTIDVIEYPDTRYDKKYWELESIVLNLLFTHEKDQFIVFCPTIKYTFLLAKRLRERGITSEAHNSRRSRADKQSIEAQFKSGDIQVLTATPTVSVGVNLPARRVIVMDTIRGIHLIDAMELVQECGRAGRPQYDTEGNAYVLCPEGKKEDTIYRMNNIKIVSRLTERRDQQFHICNLIHQGWIHSYDDVVKWWMRTLRLHLNDESDEEQQKKYIVSVASQLMFEGIINVGNGGELSLTKLGNVCASLYLYPDDVLRWTKQFTRLVNLNYWIDEVAVAAALVSESQVCREDFIRRGERGDMEKFQQAHGATISEIMGVNSIVDADVKWTYYNYLALTDTDAPQGSDLRNDIERTITGIKWALAVRGIKNREVDIVQLRVRYGVPAELIELVKVKGLGSKRAKTLYGAGVKGPRDILNHKEKVKNLFGKWSEGIIRSARAILASEKRRLQNV